ncbi:MULTISPECIES: MbcA/ParS/Xre antitoxin family protein [unclassified Marinobacter]|jgi:uncharacterized protein (DUF2384 family)|uniref:MbcA/ParS/Xre antitoxin family protein n=1 Tax=unclassified Marinobacter TaxID=83889 RepID=UPI000C4BD6E5|nr:MULTISPECIES: MbcA/ParS/Xre antitoxin family protein [unclassified Marinobacter]MAB52967.1 hypothetical protein [Marinobacter sp.]MBN14025.1 hypothetical protein [Pelagibacterium sp.]|tara:strand:+ start:561 stop:833 length:273 start_codon:yes stop_codon:yes gene_type:complete
MPDESEPNGVEVPAYNSGSISRQLCLSELRSVVWHEVIDLFEGDEAEARDWMTRNRPFLGNVAPEEMLDSRESIDRLRCFIQQIQRGVFP